MNFNQKLTKFLCLIVVLALITYGSIILGTLAHELTHVSKSVNPHFIQVNYDTSGVTYAEDFTEVDENEAYLNGNIITICLILISQIALFVLIHQ